MTTKDNYIFELSDKVVRKSVSYKNRYGIMISADLYMAKNIDMEKKYPAVIIGPPYGGVKEQGPGIYAQELAQRGFVALAFAPSFNGYSGGEPRRVSSPEIFVEDFSAAVDFMGTKSFIDREKIGIIGICGSGGFALSAAQVDIRIKAVATISMYDISRNMSMGFGDSMTREAWDATLEALAEARYADFEGNAPRLAGRGAPIGFDENTDLIGREFGEFYATGRGYHPNSSTQFTLTSCMSFMNFPLLSKIDKISPRPILFVIGENAHSRYFSEDAYEQAEEPKGLLVIPDSNHVDLYDKTDKIPFDKLTEFFMSNLR